MIIKPQWKKVILSIYVILVLSVFYHIYYAKRIIPGVKIGTIRVGGMTYDKALETLKKVDSTLEKKIIFKYYDDSFEITDEQIGFFYSWDPSVTRAFEVGRTKNLIIDTRDKLAGLLKSIYLPPFYDYEGGILENELLRIKGEVSKVPEDAKVVYNASNNNALTVVDSSLGYKVSEDSLKTMVTYAFDHLDYGEKELPVHTVNPQIQSDDLTPLLDTVKRIVSKDFIVKYATASWALTDQQKLNFLSFNKVDNKVEISINDVTLDAFIDLIRQDIDVLPRGQVTTGENNKVLSFDITQEGLELDTKKFSEDFKNAFFGEGTEVKVTTRTVSKLDKDTYGIYALLGEGKSKYTGSGRARINNLILAAKKTNGVLVPPNGIYSMNKAIGAISAATGYDTAYIISGGRTILGEGGGVCQTSTTLFRAVLNSGLPIVMRYPHDYRVYYYEIDSPVGLDASIFQPSLDFQFKNDSPNYVLVQSSWDLDEQSLTFRIYGTPDGRLVEVSDPIVTGVTPPPPALYQDDSTLPKGVVRQIDFAAWGANVSFTRTVRKEDNVISDATFVSRYSPWRAIYLVGTKE